MTELSPQAQAVLSAWAKPVDIERSLVINGQALEAQARGALAAALRAAADQLTPYTVSEMDGAAFARNKLLAIAAELKGSDG